MPEELKPIDNPHQVNIDDPHKRIAAGQESRSFGRLGNQQETTSGARVRSLPRT